MTSQINHAETAKAQNKEAMIRQSFWASWRWQRSAQVHATLALVEATERVAEQARIENLIALNLSAERLGRGTGEELGCEVSGLLADEGVRKALGL